MVRVGGVNTLNVFVGSSTRVDRHPLAVAARTAVRNRAASPATATAGRRRRSTRLTVVGFGRRISTQPGNSSMLLIHGLVVLLLRPVPVLQLAVDDLADVVVDPLRRRRVRLVGRVLGRPTRPPSRPAARARFGPAVGAARRRSSAPSPVRRRPAAPAPAASTRPSLTGSVALDAEGRHDLRARRRPVTFSSTLPSVLPALMNAATRLPAPANRLPTYSLLPSVAEVVGLGEVRAEQFLGPDAHQRRGRVQAAVVVLPPGREVPEAVALVVPEVVVLLGDAVLLVDHHLHHRPAALEARLVRRRTRRRNSPARSATFPSCPAPYFFSSAFSASSDLRARPESPLTQL